MQDAHGLKARPSLAGESLNQEGATGDSDARRNHDAITDAFKDRAIFAAREAREVKQKCERAERTEPLVPFPLKGILEMPVGHHLPPNRIRGNFERNGRKKKGWLRDGAREAENKNVEGSVQTHDGMAQSREANPHERNRPPLEHVHKSEKDERGREISRVHVLIGDEKRGASDGQREQNSEKSHSAPVRGWFSKTTADQPQRTEEQKKQAYEMPDESDPFEREVRRANDRCNRLMKQGDADVEQKKVGVERIERRIDEFFDGRKIDGHVFDAVMIAADENRDGRDCQQEQGVARALFN